MSYTLRTSGVIVGRSELEERDAARRTARGAFRPGLGYDLVQPIFALRAEAGDPAVRERYRRAREALQLELTDPAGRAIQARELHIGPRSADANAGLEIEVITHDPAFWSANGD